MLNSTLTLEEYAVQEVRSLNGNESSLKKIISLVKKLKKNGTKAAPADDSVMTPEDKKQILAEIKDGLIEAEMVKRGMIESRPISELINEL